MDSSGEIQMRKEVKNMDVSIMSIVGNGEFVPGQAVLSAEAEGYAAFAQRLELLLKGPADIEAPVYGGQPDNSDALESGDLPPAAYPEMIDGEKAGATPGLRASVPTIAVEGHLPGDRQGIRRFSMVGTGQSALFGNEGSAPLTSADAPVSWPLTAVSPWESLSASPGPAATEKPEGHPRSPIPLPAHLGELVLTGGRNVQTPESAMGETESPAAGRESEARASQLNSPPAPMDDGEAFFSIPPNRSEWPGTAASRQFVAVESMVQDETAPAKSFGLPLPSNSSAEAWKEVTANSSDKPERHSSVQEQGAPGVAKEQVSGRAAFIAVAAKEHLQKVAASPGHISQDKASRSESGAPDVISRDIHATEARIVPASSSRPQDGNNLPVGEMPGHSSAVDRAAFSPGGSPGMPTSLVWGETGSLAGEGLHRVMSPSVSPEATNSNAVGSGFASARQLAEHVMGQIQSRFRMMVHNGREKITLQLEPEYLGKVKMDVSLHNHHLIAQMTTDSAATRELIASHVHTLRESLLDHGFRLDSFQVNCEQNTAGRGFEDGRQGFGDGWDRHAQRGPEDGSSSSDETASYSTDSGLPAAAGRVNLFA
jgi:hypothetical protein